MAGQPGRSGGKRSGAGRKSVRDQYAEQVEVAEGKIASEIAKIVANLLRCAGGLGKRKTEKWALAGTVLVERALTYANGEPMIGPSGKALIGKAPLFPNKSPDELVLVERTTITDPPNPAVNMYLLSRILGNPITPRDIPEESNAADALATLRKFLGVNDDGECESPGTGGEGMGVEAA